jgi:hypothetical protein
MGVVLLSCITPSETIKVLATDSSARSPSTSKTPGAVKRGQRLSGLLNYYYRDAA